MRNKVLAVMCGLGLAAVSAMAQGQPNFLDIMKVKVRGDKMMDYQNAVKKLADVNRKYKGDYWIALSTEYGEAGTLYFSSPRENMAGIEKAFQAFDNAMNKGLGPAGTAKLMQEFYASSISAYTEIRRRRPDASVNVPADAAEMMKMVAQTRWIEVAKIDLKPGKTYEFVQAWKPFREELAKIEPKAPILVSQAMTGTPAVYISTYFKSMAEMDTVEAALRQATTTEAYRNFVRMMGDAASMTNWEILRLRPELSCMPDEFIALDPAFWKPKPPAAAKPKPAESAKPKT